MAFVNAFIRAGNEHRDESIGGRSSNNSTWAWLNCATHLGQFAMRVKAEVFGQGLSSRDRRRKDGDQRKAHFTVELPEPSEAVSVEITTHGAGLRRLAFLGAMLCAAKGVQEMVNGDAEHGAKCIDFAKETVEQLEEKLSDLPEVTLPGGVTLKHALACVEYVKRLKAQGGSQN
jgi:hypothetical protein